MSNTNKNLVAFTTISFIFFIFGFATTFIITLSAKVKEIFELNEFTAQLLTASFFIAYPLLAVPTGYIIKKIGYKKSLITGLVLMAMGSFIFYPAATLPSFSLFMVGTFILASGVVFLQTAANPFVTALGNPETASGRLNLTQALNSIATMLAPWIIAVFIFKNTSEVMTAAESARTVKMPFLIMGIMVAIVAIIIGMTKLPEVGGSDAPVGKSVWKYPHVILGAVAIFCYVGAEVGIAGLIVNYLGQPENGGISLEVASKYAAMYWGGAMVGRFFGSIMLSEIKSATRKFGYLAGVLVLAFLAGAFVTGGNWNYATIFLVIAVVNLLAMTLGKGKPARSLAVFALLAGTMAIVTSLTSGSIAVWTILSIGFFNSIMFPNIFSLAVADLDNGELSKASGIINALIVGGALIPLGMGKIADLSGYTWAFILPALCYLYIVFFAVKGSKLR
ncbi:MFS transporter [Puteibacter caeruleilacunae]|nr:MFS transporter [Puteibacter caeruleilacunae]